MEFIVGWHIYGLILVALVGQITLAQTPTYCPSGIGPLFVTAVASRNTTIKSYNYPFDYDNNMMCEWHVQIESKLLYGDYVLKVVFNDFELEAEPSSSTSVCPYDNLTFYDGDSDFSPLLGSYCDTVHPEVVYSTGNDLYIKLNTDKINTFRGFSISILVVEEVYDEEHCLPGNTNNLNLKLTGSYGTLQSPEYYPPELYCEWLITVPEGKKVELSFEIFDLDPQTAKYGCEDYVQVHDGDSVDSNTIDSFCGSVIPKPLKSSGRHMYIRFQGDSENGTPRRGFKATFKVAKEFPTVAVTIGVIVGVAILIIMVYCAVHHLQQRRTPNRSAGVEYPMTTTTTSASRPTEEPLQPAGSTSSPSVGYASVPTNPPPPEYPHPLESPPRYPGEEEEPQFPLPGQSYLWQQSSGSAPVPKSS